jgi:Tfp pilus assembly protein PilF
MVALNLAPAVDANVGLAKLLLRTGQPAGAKKLLETALATAPENAEAHDGLARVLRAAKAGRPAKIHAIEAGG